MDTQISCPRRFMAGAQEADGWDTNRWEPRNRPDDATFFPPQFTPPRTCSYCGSVHPEDAIALMEKGWEVETSSKSYKRYMHPPGYVRQQLRLFEVPGMKEPKGYREPTPPMKLYVMHMTPDQIDRFNSILAKQP